MFEPLLGRRPNGAKCSGYVLTPAGGL